MKTSELRFSFERMSADILDVAAEIVAATATDYFVDSFRRKGFDGKAWLPARTPEGQARLLVASGALRNSILPAIVTRHRVVISAGNSKVGYAQAHNEGFTAMYNVSAHTRRRGSKQVAVRAHQRHGSVPQRRFIGRATELDRAIRERIEGYIQSIT